MYPHERSLVQRLSDKPFALIGVNSDPDLERLREVVKEQRLTWRSFFDGGMIGGPIATKWGVTGWPTIYVLDAKGVIRAIGVRGTRMDRVVDQLLAEIAAK
jgi:hypothetical protein